ncbi:hypothetical protein HGG78_18360 [Vibrio aestuarianus]|uniref:hypothetical protein n=1 Tax=Vibrio aestuarianus TaxID=28171 RepID=UPI001558793B|nr:hypothetical protein [Vibrio aestuarianus]NGZ15673.1 hypothetical protein [Vibrio aestuarianus]NKZ51821.1 hypothetical protein [Vibrio aestuarianus]
MRDIKALEKELGINIINTETAISIGATRYFLTHNSSSKLDLNYNCYEQNLYDENILEKELREKNKKTPISDSELVSEYIEYKRQLKKESYQ